MSLTSQMECNREIKRFFWSNPRRCKGKLIKLSNYYVCNECCRDTKTFKEISKLGKEKRGALSEKPKGKCIEILYPELNGYYTYKLIPTNEWRKKFTIYGKDNKLIGSIEIEDYTDAPFIIHYRGPSCVVRLSNREIMETISINPNEIVFYE